jgi:hypothetical protein
MSDQQSIPAPEYGTAPSHTDDAANGPAPGRLDR